MKGLILSLLLLLTSCSNYAKNSDEEASAISIWNPLSYHWAAILPWNWFSSTLTLNDQGLNGINGQTVLNEKNLQQTLGNSYQLRSGMRLVNRNILKFWQGLADNQVAFEFIGNTTLEQMEITTKAVKGPGGVQIGSMFSKSYQKAFPNCIRNVMTGDVRCKAPHSRHIFLVYSGKTNIAEDLLPPDTQLAKWKLTKMLWQK
jgi:hypothetical protein